MARREVIMPQMGESITTGTITKWNKTVGDVVELDEILFEISTDKVESEIPSAFEGKIVEVLFPEGETVPVDTVVAYIDEDVNAEVSSSSTPSPKSEESTPVANSPVESSAAAAVEYGSNDWSSSERFYTPLVKKLAQENNISVSELNTIKGSGLGGRVNKADFENYLKTRGSGTTTRSATTTTRPAAPAPTPAPLDFDANNVIIEPMDNMRKAIARNMVESNLTSPHVNSVDEIDMTNLVKYRENIKDDFFKQEGFKLTYTHFIIYALIQALKDFPKVNASVDGDNLVIKKEINIGCAVAVPGNGLVVPIIHQADNLNLLGLCRRVNELALKARSKKLTMADLTGGTYTFTNVGSFGTLFATPIILQPQIGIFASGVIKKRVMITNEDAIAIRHMMYGTHTYDHRVIDGELGGRFLDSVKKHLESMNPQELL
ncbi:2-oxo acid dehydrogenase subunit E2 [Bacteriovoracaceae bacterium]|nr:2-oxo acid dehydrogenase subunit E2 [Bacteriovoracaceae bacterium]